MLDMMVDSVHPATRQMPRALDSHGAHGQLPHGAAASRAGSHGLNMPSPATAAMSPRRQSAAPGHPGASIHGTPGRRSSFGLDQSPLHQHPAQLGGGGVRVGGMGSRAPAPVGHSQGRPVAGLQGTPSGIGGQGAGVVAGAGGGGEGGSQASGMREDSSTVGDPVAMRFPGQGSGHQVGSWGGLGVGGGVVQPVGSRVQDLDLGDLLQTEVQGNGPVPPQPCPGQAQGLLPGGGMILGQGSNELLGRVPSSPARGHLQGSPQGQGKPSTPLQRGGSASDGAAGDLLQGLDWPAVGGGGLQQAGQAQWPRQLGQQQSQQLVGKGPVLQGAALGQQSYTYQLQQQQQQRRQQQQQELARRKFQLQQRMLQQERQQRALKQTLLSPQTGAAATLADSSSFQLGLGDTAGATGDVIRGIGIGDGSGGIQGTGGGGVVGGASTSSIFSGTGDLPFLSFPSSSAMQQGASPISQMSLMGDVGSRGGPRGSGSGSGRDGGSSRLMTTFSSQGGQGQQGLSSILGLPLVSPFSGGGNAQNQGQTQSQTQTQTQVSVGLSLGMNPGGLGHQQGMGLQGVGQLGTGLLQGLERGQGSLHDSQVAEGPSQAHQASARAEAQARAQAMRQAMYLRQQKHLQQHAQTTTTDHQHQHQHQQPPAPQQQEEQQQQQQPSVSSAISAAMATPAPSSEC
ncbi:unnamed protein product [Discosporangium mesarthrocarpum]